MLELRFARVALVFVLAGVVCFALGAVSLLIWFFRLGY